MNAFQVYALAIGANLSFSTSTLVFSHYARRFSPIWMNQTKVLIAFTAFLIAMFISGQMVPVSLNAIALMLLSGLAGLCVGDIFLFRAFTTLGSGRSLVLYSFEPLLIGLYGYLFLNQIFTLNHTLAVICMIICVFIFMLERNKQSGSWDFKSFVWAFLGIFLDSLGVMLTRSAYEITPGLETFQVNVIRCTGALIGFLLISPRSYPLLISSLKTLPQKDKLFITSAAVCGCFLSLTLYLAALKYAHVGTLAALSITGPVWVALLECVYYRRFPNFYLLSAFAFFLTGFYLMVIA